MTKPHDPKLYTAKHWRDRADEAFRNAEDMTDPYCKRLMLKQVALYEMLALRYEEDK